MKKFIAGLVVVSSLIALSVPGFAVAQGQNSPGGTLSPNNSGTTPTNSGGTASPATGPSVLDPVCHTDKGKNADVCSPDNNKTQIAGPNGIVVKITRLVSVVTGVASVIAIMIGGFQYITSTGDGAAINKAKNTILYAIIGLVVAAFAPFIVGYVIGLFQ
jgi:hypothetical protein